MDDALRKEWDATTGSRLKIEIEDISNQIVAATPNPNLDIVEDRKKIEEPQIKDLTHMINRVSNILRFVDELDALERPLFFHKYPRLSKVYEVLFLIFVWGFNPRYFLSYILSFILVLFATGHAAVKRRIGPILQSLFWDHPNKYYRPSTHIQLVS